VEAKSRRIAREEPAMPTKLLKTNDRRDSERVGFEPSRNERRRRKLRDAL
jgi:hypothetical protein